MSSLTRYQYEKTHPYYNQVWICKGCKKEFVGRTGRRWCSKKCWAYFGGNHIGKCKPGLEAIECPTIADIAWAAGIYEGEGCAMRKQAGAVVSQKDPWLLYKMQRLFGGHVGLRHKLEHGQDYEIYQWGITGTRARGFLMTIFSFLSPRRQEQIKISLFSGVNPNRSKSESIGGNYLWQTASGETPSKSTQQPPSLQ